jgi:hypothetical protein
VTRTIDSLDADPDPDHLTGLTGLRLIHERNL